jgi:hypothetical protein
MQKYFNKIYVELIAHRIMYRRSYVFSIHGAYLNKKSIFKIL